MYNYNYLFYMDSLYYYSTGNHGTCIQVQGQQQTFCSSQLRQQKAMAELCRFHIVTCMIFAGLRFLWALNGRQIIGQKNDNNCIKVPALSQHIHVKSTAWFFQVYFEEFEVIVTH